MRTIDEILNPDERRKREDYSSLIMTALTDDCLTRKPRDPVKRNLMRLLGLAEKYPEVCYPSPGNTPEDLEEDI